MGFILAGFDERDGTTPIWLPDTEVEDIDDAIAQAEKWIAGRMSVRADVLQVTKRTGRAVLSVTTDGVEKLSPRLPLLHSRVKRHSFVEIDSVLSSTESKKAFVAETHPKRCLPPVASPASGRGAWGRMSATVHERMLVGNHAAVPVHARSDR